MDLAFQVPMQYYSLLHLPLLLSTVTSTTECCFHFDSISSFFLELFLHSSPVAHWAPPTWGVHLSVSYLFAFSYCSCGFQGKNTEEVCHSLLQWTTFFQNSLLWPVHLGWPYTVWLIVRDWELPGNFTSEARGIWLQNFHRIGETDSWKAQTKPCAHQDTGKGAVTPQETEPDLPVSV